MVKQPPQDCLEGGKEALASQYTLLAADTKKEQKKEDQKRRDREAFPLGACHTSGFAFYLRNAHPLRVSCFFFSFLSFSDIFLITSIRPK